MGGGEAGVALEAFPLLASDAGSARGGREGGGAAAGWVGGWV